MSTKRKAHKKGTLTDDKLLELIDTGKSQPEIAKQYGISRQAVSKRLKKIKGVQTKVVATKASQFVKNKIDIIETLNGLNKEALEVLEDLKGWRNGDEKALKKIEKNGAKSTDPYLLTIKTLTEIRNQCKEAREIAKELYNMQAILEFQNTVLETITEVSPETRDAIIAKLNSKRAVRQAVKFA